MKAELVPFHGQQIEGLEHDGKVWAGVRRICENLGIDDKGQREKLQGLDWATTQLIPAQGPDGKTYETFCIDLDSLPMWLATIHASKVKEEVRPALLAHQRYCKQVLADHFLGRAEPFLTAAEAQAIIDRALVAQLATFQRLFKRNAPREYMNVVELAELFGTTPHTIKRRLKDPLLAAVPFQVIDRTHYWRLYDFEQAWDQRPRPRMPNPRPAWEKEQERRGERAAEKAEVAPVVPVPAPVIPTQPPAPPPDLRERIIAELACQPLLPAHLATLLGVPEGQVLAVLTADRTRFRPDPQEEHLFWKLLPPPRDNGKLLRDLVFDAIQAGATSMYKVARELGRRNQDVYKAAVELEALKLIRRVGSRKKGRWEVVMPPLPVGPN